MQNLFEYLINKQTKQTKTFNNFQEFLDYIKEIGGGYEKRNWWDSDSFSDDQRYCIFLGKEPKNGHLGIHITPGDHEYFYFVIGSVRLYY